MTLDEFLSSAGYSLRKLDDDHFSMNFDCGRDSSLSDWLRSHGMKWQNEDLCSVWALSPANDGTSICGYFTLSAHQIIHRDVQKKDRSVDASNRPWVNAVDAAPAQLLGKFAVDCDMQGQGVGSLLMLGVYGKHLEAASLAGAKYLVLEAREQALVSYYKKTYGFVPSSTSSDLTQMYRPTKAIRDDFHALNLD